MKEWQTYAVMYEFCIKARTESLQSDNRANPRKDNCLVKNVFISSFFSSNTECVSVTAGIYYPIYIFSVIILCPFHLSVS